MDGRWLREFCHPFLDKLDLQGTVPDGSRRPPPPPTMLPKPTTPYDFGPIYFDRRDPDAPSAIDSRHSRKRENQTTRWLQNIIPLLIPIYIELVQKTDNLRTLDALQHVDSAGFFPVRAVGAILAIDLRVLEFVMALFLNMHPIIPLTKTLETYLDSMGYKLVNRVVYCILFIFANKSHPGPLRRRFGNALECEEESSPAATPPPDSSPPASPTKRRRAGSPSPSPTKPARYSSPSASPSPSPSPSPPSSPTDSRPDYPFSEPEERSRPSDYLRARCPPVSGEMGRSRDDPGCDHVRRRVLPQDGTKARAGGILPTDIPPPSLSRGVTKKMESFVDSKGGSEDEDHIEDPEMPVPKSVLDDCQASFSAADEKRMKSSTSSSTTRGMGLNCDTTTSSSSLTCTRCYTCSCSIYRGGSVGFLYDIACQLERSARLWGFLPPEMLARLQFAVSVLHAFGHHWVCQMLFHPRRRRFFGLSDGEGCERFWHSISKLIGYLRVCGYHHRLYTLDSQIHHLQRASIRRLGAWLARRWAHTQEKRREATEALEECAQPMTLLRAEYKKQLAAQTKPLPKRTRNAGKIAIEEVLRLRKVLVVLRARVRGCEEAILDPTADLADIEIATQDLQIATAKLRKHEATLRAKEAALGVADKQMLRHLLKSEYIRCRMNARALKYRIREKLRSRKFELERVDQFVHRKKTTDPKLKTHIEDAVKRRDPGIQELVRNYNKLCAQMASLIKRKKAPKNAIAPEPIDPKSIWGLDVDDEIWQDVGLDDAYDDQEPPLWLKDEAVRTGIKAMLELDRCLEEEPRVFHECRALRWWLSEEWDAVTSAKAVAAEDGRRRSPD
ncbi:hypothetical protein B0H13DRAFT_2234789 [Mycena leptocephala]|nr:hypothetical protein B0H13DRAFT_2234789 [Mycena leptocephala]